MDDTLTKEEFDFLVRVGESQNAAERNHTTVQESLTRRGYILEGELTDSGWKVLEPYRAKRAIFIAAGFGSRLVPITLNTPKPLIRVNGIRIIDTLINAVLKAGIEEVIIVRGYLSEQFDQLRYQYPTIKFVENPDYCETNNISSVICVKELLRNAYVFEADLLLRNPLLIKKYHYKSNFLAIPKKRSEDWCFTVENGIIRDEKLGGSNCHQMVGISYWDDPDGKRLAEDMQRAYEMPGGKEYYWEQVPLTVFREHYRVGIYECAEDDVVEIDTFSELKAVDKSYDV